MAWFEWSHCNLVDKEKAKMTMYIIVKYYYNNCLLHIHLQSDFHSELEALKQHLDDRYELCRSCRNIVKRHLNVQAVDLKTFLLGSHLQQSKSTPTKVTRLSFYLYNNFAYHYMNCI